MRQNPQLSALLRQVRAWQKAVFTQITFESESRAPSQATFLAPFNITRHLILILFVLRIFEERQGLTLGERFQTRVPIDSLSQLQQGDRLYLRLVELWRSIQPRFAGLPVALELLPDLPLSDRLLRSMICRLYRAEDFFLLSSSSLLGQVYETLLKDSPFKDSPARSSQRKSQGIYYTPAAIVQFMVRETIDRLLKVSEASDRLLDVHHLPRLLDPACGGGAFLLEAYQILLDWQLQQLVACYPTGHDELLTGWSGEWQLSWTARQQILQHCIYGVDLDPEAVTITQLSLWLKLLEDPRREADCYEIALNQKLPDLNANLQTGNALLDEDASPQVIIDRETQGMNWEKAFPAVMRSGGFDGVIGNPPYLDSEQMTLSCPTWRTYCATRYQTAIGNWDLFCVFIEKALMLCRSGGITSLIVPNKLASAPYAAQARSLLMRHQLLLIRDYAQVPVFAASVYPLVYVVQKGSLPSQSNQPQVRYEVMDNLAQVQRSGWLSRNGESLEACWQLAESVLHAQVMARLQQLPTLGSIAQVYGAATVAEAYALKPWLQECETSAPEDFRFVNSGTIDRYAMRWGKKPTRYLGQIYQHPVLSGDRLGYLAARRQQQARQPKIIVAGLSQQLECVLDAAGNVLAGKSTCIIERISQSIDWLYLLALLNSRLLTGYLRSCASGNQLQSGYLRIGTMQLKQLPISLPDLAQSIDRKIYTEIIDLARLSISERVHNPLDEFKNWHPEIDPQIDQRIAYLYRLTDEEAAAITQTQIEQGQ